MRDPIRTSLLAAALLAAAPARAQAPAQRPAPAAAPARDARPADAAHSEKGVRFSLPPGFSVVDRQELEPGGDEDTVYVARRGSLEVRVEVEDGLLDCKELPGATRRAGKTADGRDTCEAEASGPPLVGEKVVERRGALVAVQFGARHLSVLAFAPEQATAVKLAREVAATGAEER